MYCIINLSHVKTLRLLHTQDVTIKRTDKRTGEVVRFTRPMFMVERTEVNLPRHLRKYVKAKKDGKNWEDRRRSVGRWGPSSDEKVGGEKKRKEMRNKNGRQCKKKSKHPTRQQ